MKYFTSESTRLPESRGPPGWVRRWTRTFISDSIKPLFSISFTVSAFTFAPAIVSRQKFLNFTCPIASVGEFLGFYGYIELLSCKRRHKSR
ncbi:unnamed protein product, partial [Linum tenue]